MKEQLVICVEIVGEKKELDRDALEQDITHALREWLQKYSLDLREVIITHNLLAGALEDHDPSNEIAFAFDGTVTPD